MQNAHDAGPRDDNQRVEIAFVLGDDQFVVSHTGKPFVAQELAALLSGGFSKEFDSEETTGRFGTGFLVTHALSTRVDVAGVLNTHEGPEMFHIELERDGDEDSIARNIFGMKLHIGVDSGTGLVHRLPTTPANVHDVTEAHRLLHGGESRVWGDAWYVGVQKREENRGLAVDWQVGMSPGQRRKLEPGSPAAVAEQVKESIRAKVEHPFLKVKRGLEYGEVRYRGLAKNTQRLALLPGLGNLLPAESRSRERFRGKVGPEPGPNPKTGLAPSQNHANKSCNQG